MSGIFFPGLAAVRRGATVTVSGTPPGPGAPPGTPRIYLDARMGLFTDTAGTTPVTSDGDLIACWTDQSANGYKFTQSTADRRPLYKVNIDGQAESVQYDDSNDYLVAASDIQPTGGMTAFVLLRWHPLISATGAGITGPGSAGEFHWRLDTDAKQMAISDNVAVIGKGNTAVTASTWTQVGVAWDGTAGSFRQAKAADGNISYGSAVTAAVKYLAVDGVANGAIYGGEVAVVLVYDGILTALTTPKRTDVEDWITSEFGI